MLQKILDCLFAIFMLAIVVGVFAFFPVVAITFGGWWAITLSFVPVTILVVGIVKELLS